MVESITNAFTSGKDLVVETTDNVTESVKNGVVTVSSSIKNGTGTVINGTKSISSDIYDKMNENFSISKIESILEDIGYVISKVEISITLPPRMLFQIDIERSHVDRDKEEEFLNHEDKNNDDIVVRKIIQGISKALDFNGKVKFNKKHLAYLEVEVSMIPTVRLVFLDY